jgi:hypothetical protein
VVVCCAVWLGCGPHVAFGRRLRQKPSDEARNSLSLPSCNAYVHHRGDPNAFLFSVHPYQSRVDLGILAWCRHPNMPGFCPSLPSSVTNCGGPCWGFLGLVGRLITGFFVFFLFFLRVLVSLFSGFVSIFPCCFCFVFFTGFLLLDFQLRGWWLFQPTGWAVGRGYNLLEFHFCC